MKTLFYSALKAILLVSIYLHFCPSSELKAQSFSQNNIDLNGKGTINNGTSLTFGPDGRLYVAEYVGVIKALTLERTDEGDYIVTEMEQINGIQSIQGYNDDGSLHESTMRQTIGLEVIGTATNPVIYVSTSDFRIGGGGGGGSGDVGLDTNSGIITRFSWNGIGWDELDIVRGLPRSEENHSTNNMEFTTINGEDYLIVASGGHTNAGGPSTNFAYTTEYALSAAILSVNLTMLENMPILDDNGRKYIYDIPTLDDPSRPNLNGITDPDAPGYDGIDFNDPFGGNDGLNQAMIMAGGPVQIFSPGYRNAYDLVVTESGAVYVTDNGANGGWGGFPVNEGGGDANNDYDPGEPGSSYTSGGEKINNKDHLSLVTLDIQSYQFGSFYGGHPTPVRANPYGAGLYTNPAITGTEGAIFRTLIYHPNKDIDGFTSNPALGLPANWPPVGFANPVEGDYRGPGDPNPDGPEDALVTTWGTNTNAIDEYTASNFNGAMKGDLIAGVNTGVLRRVQLNEDGSLKELTPSFASGIGGDALGVACNGDNDIFPGTIWVVTLNGKLVVFEPQDFGICLQPEDEGYDSLADYDGDGYTNQDEIDNETDHCNGGSQPNDHNKAAGAPLISDLNDLDDDNDGIPDTEDPFQLGNPMESGSDAFSLPVVNELFSSNPDLQGYMGLGLTGLMNNGDPNPNWLNWLDRRDDPSDPNPNDILGGAIGAMTMQMTTGTALGTNNNQEKGFQYGVRVDQSTGVFTVAGGLFNFNDPLQLYGHPSTPNGELGIFIGTGFQDNYIKFVLTKSGLTIQQEINDVPLDPLLIPVPEQNRPESGAALFYVIDPVSGNIAFEYIFDNGPRISAGSIVAQGAILEAIQSSEKDLAVGLIGSSNEQGIELEGTWDYLHVSGSAPYIVKELPDVTGIIGSVDQTIDLSNHFNDDYGTDNLQFSIVNNSNPAIEAFVVENILEISFPPSPEVSDITVRATDADNLYVEQTLRITVNEAPISNILYRINAGGPTIMSLDGEVDWEADTSGQNSLYLTEAGGNNTSGFSFNNYSEEIDLSTTPTSIFNTERSDHWSGPPNVTYSFPVEQGKYEVRLYMGNGYHGTSDPGERIFDVGIEGITHPEIKDIDLSGTFGHRTGSVLTKIVDVNDGFLDISLLHGQIENPLINGIEILGSSRGETPIVVSQIPDQFNIVGEELDGSLAAVASGGDGNLSYSISGAPEGVFIEPTNGQIGGTINNNANNQSPYTITIIVDDGDGYSNDAANISFTWTITAGEPYIVQEIPDLNRLVDSDDEIINLNNFFDDNAGKENILYSIEDNSNPLVNTAILDSLLTISFPSEASIANITVRATDTDNYYVEQLFGVTVNAQTSDPAPPTVLYRVNSGGPAIASIDGEIDWGADTSSENSPYLAEAGGNNTASSGMKNYTDSVDLETTPTSIFNSERSDYFSGMPNVMYSFPLDPGTYEIRLYLGNGYHGTSKAGQRIYNVEMEGIVHPELEGIDISGTFGHKVGAVINKTVNVTDGFLNISFIHGVENPLINGIEILGSTESSVENPIEVTQVANQANIVGDVLNGSLVVSATGGDGDLVYSLTGAPLGVTIDAASGVISGTIDMEADVSSPYSVVVEVDDSDTETTDAVTTGFTWTVTETPQTLIEVSAVANQANIVGDVLDGSLVVSATGGDGDLVYSLTGAPLGVTIDASSGVISGTIDMEADVSSPYSVVVEVDDSDTETTDAVTTGFTWTVITGEPYIITALPDLERTTGATNEDILLDDYFGDNNGVENLSYTVTQNTNTNIGAGIVNNVLTLTYPSAAAVSAITIRATDASSNFVEQSFSIVVSEQTSDPAPPTVLYRVNSGGPAIASIDGEIDWGADTSSENSPYLAEAGGNNTASSGMKNYTDSVDLETTPTSIFNSERSDYFSGMPNVMYSFPLDPGTYEIRLYLGNGYHGTSKAGQRIYNVEMEGIVHPELEGIDISGTFGHKVGAVINKTVNVTDGFLNISFIHGVENPLINGIEILGSTSLLDIKTSEEQIKEAEAIIPDEDVKMVVAEATTVKLYPNPAQFDVYLQFSDPKLKISNISVYDFNGRFLKFFDKFQIIEKGKGEYRFNISGMSDGVYILKIFTENFDVFTLRLIKKD